MNPGKRNRQGLLVSRILLGLVLLSAGWMKAMHVPEFADAVAGFHLLPPLVMSWTAVVVPWLELVTGLLLLTNLWVRASGLMAGFLFGAFALSIGSAWVRGLAVECGCFGSLSSAAIPPWIHLGGVIAGALLAAWIAWTAETGSDASIGRSVDVH